MPTDGETTTAQVAEDARAAIPTLALVKGSANFERKPSVLDRPPRLLA
jgi:hypothetical protein